MWRTVSLLAAQAPLTGCSEARMSTIRDVRIARNTGCRNSRRGASDLKVVTQLPDALGQLVNLFHLLGQRGGQLIRVGFVEVGLERIGQLCKRRSVALHLLEMRL